MKQVISVSLGSAKRDFEVKLELAGEEVLLRRIGTGGSIKKAINLIRTLDGKVEALGMGGIDLYLFSGDRKYVVREALRIARNALRTPIVDGSGLKNTLERRVVNYIDKNVAALKGKKVLMVSSVDRFGMAETFVSCGAEVIFGDIMFALGIKLPLRNINVIRLIARMLLPVAVRMPIAWVYPVGAKQEKRFPKFTKFYQWADIIAGDFIYIKKHMPKKLSGKTILTNTITRADIEELRKTGLSTLITTTPCLNGRSFGTNMIEALLIAISGKKPEEMTPEDYKTWLNRTGFKARIENFPNN